MLPYGSSQLAHNGGEEGRTAVIGRSASAGGVGAARERGALSHALRVRAGRHPHRGPREQLHRRQSQHVPDARIYPRGADPDARLGHRRRDGDPTHRAGAERDQSEVRLPPGVALPTQGRFGLCGGSDRGHDARRQPLGDDPRHRRAQAGAVRAQGIQSPPPRDAGECWPRTRWPGWATRSRSRRTPRRRSPCCAPIRSASRSCSRTRQCPG